MEKLRVFGHWLQKVLTYAWRRTPNALLCEYTKIWLVRDWTVVFPGTLIHLYILASAKLRLTVIVRTPLNNMNALILCAALLCSTLLFAYAQQDVSVFGCKFGFKLWFGRTGGSFALRVQLGVYLQNFGKNSIWPMKTNIALLFWTLRLLFYCSFIWLVSDPKQTRK